MIEHMGIYLVPEMQKIYKECNYRYITSKNKDYRPLLDIANFICEQIGIPGQPENHVQQILEVWKRLSKAIAGNRFWSGKSLLTISNHIQEIAILARDGDSTKAGPKLGPDDFKDIISQRY